LQLLLVELIAKGLVQSAHDCSDGGLAVTLAECCFDTGGLGADVAIDAVASAGDGAVDVAAALFGESASRVVLSTKSEHAAAVLENAAAAGVPAQTIGRIGGRRLRISVRGAVAVDVAVEEAERIWSLAIESNFVKRVA
jgi:phosphoribosylformylglycinamidine (FGAM) synthase-like enzyme